MYQAHGDVGMGLDIDDVLTGRNNVQDQQFQLSRREMQAIMGAPSGFAADDMVAGLNAPPEDMDEEDNEDDDQALAAGLVLAEDDGDDLDPSPSDVSLNVGRQRPATVADTRAEEALVQEIQSKPDYLTRLATVVNAREAQPVTPNAESFFPKDIHQPRKQGDVDYDDASVAGIWQAAGWGSRMSAEEEAEERVRIEREKIFPYVLHILEKQVKLPAKLPDGRPNPDKLRVVHVGLKRTRRFVEDTNFRRILSDRDTRLTPQQKDVYIRYATGWAPAGSAGSSTCTSDRNYDPNLQPTEMDKINSGLNSDAREVAEATIRKPTVATFGAFNMQRFPCVFGCEGCKGKAEYVQMLIHVHETEKVRVAGRRVKDDATDPEAKAAIKAADDIVVGIVKGLGKLDNMYKSMQDRVEATACCRNGACKLAAGLWDLGKKAEQNAKDEQHANQQNSNRRYHSDTDFYNELKLAHRLRLEGRLTQSEAERMVLDSAMFSYWVESRLRHAITAVVEFAENSFKYGLQWDLKTRQEVVDLVSKVPHNHAVHIMSKHVCATLSGRNYGYYSKQEWDGYLTWSLAKAAFPDPYTSIYVLVKVFNWVAEGMPVRLHRKEKGKHVVVKLTEKKVKESEIFELVDRVASDSPAKDLLCGTPTQTPARHFSNLVWEDQEYRQWVVYNLEYAAGESSLTKGASPAAYRDSFLKAMRGAGVHAGKVKATELAMLTTWMRQNASDEDTTKLTIPTWVRTNGDKYKKGVKLSPFAPSCATVFKNCSHCNRGKIEHAAEAMGLTAYFAEVLPNFSTKWVQTLFLKACRDRDGKSNGHQILPSEVYKANEVRDDSKDAWVRKRGAHTMAIGAAGAMPVGSAHGGVTLFGPNFPGVRGKVSMTGMLKRNFRGSLRKGREHHECRVSDLTDRALATLPAHRLEELEEAKEDARSRAGDNYAVCLARLEGLDVGRPESPLPAQETALGDARGQWLEVLDGNTVGLMNATAALIEVYDQNDAARSALADVEAMSHEALAQFEQQRVAHDAICQRFTPELLYALKALEHSLMEDLDPVLAPSFTVLRRVPLWESAHGPTELKCAPNSEATRHILDNYYRLVNGGEYMDLNGKMLLLPAVLDAEKFPYDVYAINSVKRQELLWHVQRNQDRYHWYQHVKKLHPNHVPKAWDLHMSDDPLDERGVPYTTTVEGVFFIINTVDDYERYVNMLEEQAADAVEDPEMVVVVDGVRVRKYAPKPPPCFFDYWCTQNRIDPKQRWPEMRELKEQYAARIMRENEVKIEQDRENVKSALFRERQRHLSAMPSGSSTDAKNKRLASINIGKPSDEWQTAMARFNERSKWADTKLKRRLGRWVNSHLDWDEETPDEAELIANIERGFLHDLQRRFGGGDAQKHEQQRKQSASTSFHAAAEDRARLRAELALAQQQSRTRAEQERAERAHKAGEAAHANLTGVSVTEAAASTSTNATVAGILDPRAQADDDRDQTLQDYHASTTTEEDTTEEATSTRAPGIKFDATKERFDHVEDDPTWVQTRFDGLGWCNPAGRHPPAKRAKP